MGPDAELREPERRRLIAQLYTLLKDLARSEPVEKILPTLFWSFVWYSDLGRLAALIEEFKENPLKTLHFYRDSLNNVFFTSIWKGTRTGTNTPTSVPTTPTFATTASTPFPTTPTHKRVISGGEPTTSVSGSPARKRPKLDKPQRSKDAPGDCRKRDKKCVITNATEPCHAAHIIPFSFGSRSELETDSFWNTLGCFWPSAQITKWRQYIEEKSTETAENLLLQSPSVHAYFDRQLFALEPVDISDDRSTLRMRFYWLRPENVAALYPTTTIDNTDDLVGAPSMPADCPQGGREARYAAEPNLQLYNCEDHSRIISGEVISLVTDDPDRFPLPDIEIIRLHWVLHRVTALSAAAEPDEDEEFEDDFSGEPVAVENEEGSAEDSFLYEIPWHGSHSGTPTYVKC